MSRKHALNDSDSDGAGPSTASSAAKRQRQSSLPRSTPPAGGDDGGEFDPDVDSPQADEDEDDEMDDEEQRRQVDALTQEQAARASKIAEAGVIMQVDLQNFMCHARTTVDFGPQVNFLVGVNGSGKSAVLTAITMALGGNAKATNRGNKGGDLIMEGKTSARCTVTLANKGEDAFMNHIYGDKITIERTLQAKGGGGYKIKNAEGKTVDTKKATLDAMLDQFNIQVDNPMTVLTQDQSRQFLASATPKDKYTFFLRGTQLAQLTMEYEQIRSNTEQMEEALGRKKEVLPELKEAYRRAKERAREAKQAMQQEENLQTLKDEQVWAYVAEVEKQVQFGEQAIATEQAKLAGFDEEIAAANAAIEACNDTIANLKEAEADSRVTLEDKQPRLKELQELINAERQRLQRWKDSERQLNGTLKRIQGNIAEFNRQIVEEERKLSRDLEAERRPIREAIEKANNEVGKLSIRITEARRTLEETQEESRGVGEQYEAARARITDSHREFDQTKARLNHAKSSANNSLLAYGEKAPALVDAINRERRWVQRPIGPIGTLVKLNNQNYARMLESFFGPTLNGWIVTNPQDFGLMVEIKRRLRLDHNTPIFRQEYDDTFMAELSRGEPDPSLPTILRALTINDQLTLQVLVTAHKIERLALVPTRPDGDQLMRSKPRNVDVAYSADCFSLRNNNGRSSSQFMPDWRGGARLHKDSGAEIRHFEGELQRIQQEIQQHENNRQQIGQKGVALKQRREQAEQAQSQAQQRMRQLNNQIATWDAKLKEEQPNNIAALQENKRESEQELESAQSQFQAGKEAFDRQTGNIEPVVEEKREIEAKIKKAEKILGQIASHLATQYANQSTAEQQRRAAEKRKEKVEAAIARDEAEVEKTKALREERIEQATAICERPQLEKFRDARKLQKEIDGIEKALREREKRQGASIEQILAEMEVRKKVAAEAVKQTNEMAKLIQALEAAYNARISRWTDFRDHIAVRAKIQFLAHLGTRGFTGKLKFDHENCKLNLTVQTEEPDKKQKGKQKDAKALSGGEKSFSTICLLLTMWEAVGCPIRCLDEFDVFMDAVNRRIAMRMMIETAKQANQTQFVLITPQEMSSISWGDEVKVSKLDDPQRQKGALAQGK
ncbi:hypothetical protein JCM10213_000824 [Rhodosporidiobolus nylandii]